LEPRLSSISTPGAAMPPVISAPIVAPRPEKKSNAWILMLLFVALAAIAAGATVALLHR
jgi:hypothetical protein